MPRKKIHGGFVYVTNYSSKFRKLTGGKKNELTRVMFDNSSYAKLVEGESLSEFSLRAKEGLEFIVEGCKERNVLISHGWHLKVFVGLQLGMQPIQAIKTSNSVIAHFLKYELIKVTVLLSI